MITTRLKHTYQATAGEADGGGGLNIQPDPDDGEDGGAGSGSGDDDDATGGGGPVDRGDEVDGADGAAKPPVEGADDGEPAATAGAKKGGSQAVPIARLNEVIEERNALRAENEKLKAGKETPQATPQPTTAPVPAFDEAKAEREYAELLADGEFDKAVELRAKINAALIEQAEVNIENRQARRTVQTSLTEVAEQAVKAYPYLDTDTEVMAMIIAARDAGVRKGMPINQALQAAVDRIAPKFAPEGEAAGAGTPGKELPDGGPRVDTRPQGANARGAAASGRQPPVAQGAGNRATAGTVDMNDLTEEQFDALPLADKKRLRGDGS